MDIRELVEKASLLDYVAQYIEMNQDGDEWFGVCPFHGDTDPSFSISESSPYVYYCFGCGASGNILHFMQAYHKVGFPKAVELLKEFVGYVGEVTNSGASDVMKVFRQFKAKQRDAKPSHIILAEDFMQRYDAYAPQLEMWEDEDISREAMERFGVAYDWKNERIVFPIRDREGNVISVSGRTVDPDWKEKQLRKYSYYNKIQGVDLLYGLYENLEEIKKMRQVIVFEGAKSVMKAYGYGYKNCVALLTSHLNDWQLKLLISLGCEVVFALDKGVNIKEDKNITKLKQFCPVYWVTDKRNLINLKDSPIDGGKEVFASMFSERQRVK